MTTPSKSGHEGIRLIAKSGKRHAVGEFSTCEAAVEARTKFLAKAGMLRERAAK